MCDALRFQWGDALCSDEPDEMAARGLELLAAMRLVRRRRRRRHPAARDRPLQPHRHDRRATAPGGLVTERFVLKRCGLISLFHYANQVFEAEDGHLLLRGSNGSGKSTAMELIVPLLFDGNLSGLEPLDVGRAALDRLPPAAGRALPAPARLLVGAVRACGDHWVTLALGVRMSQDTRHDPWFLVWDTPVMIDPHVMLERDGAPLAPQGGGEAARRRALRLRRGVPGAGQRAAVRLLRAALPGDAEADAAVALGAARQVDRRRPDDRAARARAARDRRRAAGRRRRQARRAGVAARRAGLAA